MKFFAVFAVVAALATCQANTIQQLPTNTGLQQDFEDFLALVPVDDLVKLGVDYLMNDKEFQATFAYLQGTEFAKVWEKFFKVKEVKEVLKFVEDAGLDVFAFLNEFGHFFNLPPVNPIHSRRGTGLTGFVNDALALLPKDKLVALFEEKLQTSPEFKALYEKLTSAEFNTLAQNFLNSKEVQGYFQTLKEHGVDVVKVFQLVKEFFGWH
uniref:PpMVP1 n=2 Tax=Phlebotomus papatasi TaxID=29031 RepID=A8C9U5_PHLPP|nr:PpMVP1 [Phlebotomus papatasi]